MQGGFDTKDLARLARWYEDVLKHIPDAKRRALEAAANAVHGEVTRQIDIRVDDDRGKVKNWQQVVMGSKGGYSKVCPKSEPVRNKYGKDYGYNSAQVTSYIEHGHPTKRPSGKDPNYRPRIKKAVLSGNGPIVQGRLFYSYSKAQAGKLGIAAAEEVLEALSEEFVALLYDLS